VTTATSPAHRDAVVAASGNRSDWAVATALVGLAAARAVPYLVRGPKLFLDDWWALRNARFSGAFGAAGHEQLIARPGAWLVFNIEFGLIGRHPVALYLVQTALNAGVVVALFIVARRFLGPWTAAGVSATWALLPNHSAMDHWASTMQIVVALLFLTVGVGLVARATDRGTGMWPAILCFLVGGLCYEAVLPAAGLALLAVPLLCRGHVRWDAVLRGGVAIGLAGAWALAHSWRPVPGRYADVSLVWTDHFGAGVSPSITSGRLLATIAIVAVAAALGRLLLPSVRQLAGPPERLVIAGLIVIVIGVLPFVKFPIAVIGINDRANVVSSVGAAMVWTGLLAMLVRWRRMIGIAGILTLMSFAVSARWERDRSYWRAGRDAEVIVDALTRRFPAPAGEVLIGPAALNRSGVVGLVSDWDTSAAWQLETGRPTRAATFAGSPEEFRRVASGERLDLTSIGLP
jgi:hypothetical protein